MTEPSRRDLLRGAALGCAAGALSACARRIAPSRSLPVAPPVDGALRVPLALAPELAREGGSVIVRPAGSHAAILLVHAGGGFLALRGLCPHQGCELTWVPGDREVECPCHGSRFAADGAVLNPPARVDLDRYPAAPPDANGDIVVQLFAGDGVFREKVVAGTVRVPVAEFPALGAVGGAILGRPDGFPGPLLVTRVAADGEGAIAAVSAVCSHLGCTVLPPTCAPGPGCAGGGVLQCPCHGSQFDLQGRFLTGPAGADLIRYAASFDGVTVSISTGPA